MRKKGKMKKMKKMKTPSFWSERKMKKKNEDTQPLA
jgi:hypothetical protein